MPDRLTGSLWRALWADVPLINFAVYAVCIAHAEVANLDPPRPDLLFTFVFPLMVPVVVYALRWPRANRLQRGVAIGVVLGTLLLVGLSHFVAAYTPIGKGQLRSFYEVGAIANTLLLGVHAWTRGRAMLALFFGPAALYGLILENGGILAGFFSEMEYRLYLGPLPAPIATMSGWITVLYLAIQIAWEVRAAVPAIRRSPFGSALVATTAVLLLDLQIDPIATEIGLWRWDARLAAGPMGVPLLNFVAWGCAVFPFAWLLFLRQNAFELSPLEISARPHRRWLWTHVVSVVALATLLFCSGMALVEGGFDGPTFDIMGSTLEDWGVVARLPSSPAVR